MLPALAVRQRSLAHLPGQPDSTRAAQPPNSARPINGARRPHVSRCVRGLIRRALLTDLNFMISSSLDGTLKIGELEGLLTKRSPRISSGSLTERQSRTTRV